MSKKEMQQTIDVLRKHIEKLKQENECLRKERDILRDESYEFERKANSLKEALRKSRCVLEDKDAEIRRITALKKNLPRGCVQSEKCKDCVYGEKESTEITPFGFMGDLERQELSFIVCRKASHSPCKKFKKRKTKK